MLGVSAAESKRDSWLGQGNQGEDETKDEDRNLSVCSLSRVSGSTDWLGVK
jgi:hypothetical protein